MLRGTTLFARRALKLGALPDHSCALTGAAAPANAGDACASQLSFRPERLQQVGEFSRVLHGHFVALSLTAAR
ncbi:MAG: hypothetical protein ACC647_00515 [Anaerolineales bacterium]